jgi:ABC-type nitrate/sulfonate/bicarbonate transport system substrate-binding protein
MKTSQISKTVLLLPVIGGMLALGGCFGEPTVTPPTTPPASVQPAPNQTQVAPGVEQVQTSIRLPIPVADTAFSPLYLAVDKGFFAKRGLNVKLEPGTPETNPIKMLSQGKDQFALVGGPELLMTARNKKAPVKGIALLSKNSDFVVLVTTKKSGITTLKQLEGKKVGFFYGHISTDILHMLFKKENVNVQEVDVGFDYGQLISGQLDAQWAFRTTAGLSLPAKGVEINLISPADYGIVTNGYTLLTNEQTLKEKPKVVQAFLDAVLEATAYSLEHEQEAIDATIKRDPNFKPEVGKKQLEIYNAAIKRNPKLGQITAEDMETTKTQMVNAGLLPADFDVKAAFTTEFLDQSTKK